MDHVLVPGPLMGTMLWIVGFAAPRAADHGIERGVTSRHPRDPERTELIGRALRALALLIVVLSAVLAVV